MDAEEPDPVDGIGGLLGLAKDAVGPYLAGQQSDLIEGGPKGARNN
ncbi:hypothetical protein [Streptomyces sp. NPDC002845]